MAFYGAAPDGETLDKARQTGAFGFPEKDSRMEFVTKNINAVAVENHLSMLEKNILYFAQSVRFSDEAFGQASGVAMKFKLFNLEAKCMTSERKFTKALYRMFNVLSGYFDKKGVEYDPLEMEFTFVRNFPLNLNDEVAALATMTGLVSKQTAFSQMSFIPSPEDEIEKLKAEEEEYMKAAKELADAEAKAAAEEAALNQPEETLQPGVETPIETGQLEKPIQEV
jgi:SPP1 family phage portal protein